MMIKYDPKEIEFALQILQCPVFRKNKKVQEWLGVKEHCDLLEELRRFREAGFRDLKVKSPEVEVQWRHLQMRIKFGRLRRSLKWGMGVAAVVLLLIGVDVLLSNWYNANLPSKKIFPVVRRVMADVKLITGEGHEVLLNSVNTDSLLKKEGMVMDSVKGTRGLRVLSGNGRRNELYTLLIPRGAEYMVILDDSSRVWLNSESELRYPAVFGTNKREVYLKGEGYFEVKHDEKRPFFVVTEKVKTHVLGTEFNVQSYADKTVNVTLVRGCVAVTGTEEADVREVVLNPGENATWEDGRLQVASVDILKYVSWKDGFFYYDDEPLEDILNELGRWFDFTVFYRNPEAKNYRFKFWANRKDTPEQIMKRLNETGKLCVIFNGKNVEVSL